MPTSSLTSAKRAIARIQRLCCLGVGGQAIMPALFRELQSLVPSYDNVFFGTTGMGILRTCTVSPPRLWN
jgi:hypothetical protein